jgi:hypothetical protein
MREPFLRLEERLFNDLPVANGMSLSVFRE